MNLTILPCYQIILSPHTIKLVKMKKKKKIYYRKYNKMYQLPPPLKVLIHAKLRPVSSTGSASSISVQMWESKSKHSTDLSRSIESQLYPPATYILDPTDVQPNSALGVRMCEMTVQQSLEGVYLSIESIQVMVPSWLTVAPPISSKDPEIETRWAKNLGVEIGCFISHLSSNGL